MSNPTGRRTRFRSEIAATLLVIALAAGGVTALWPDPSPATSPTATPQALSGADAETAPLDDRVLAPTRARAGLQPCPTARPAPPPPASSSPASALGGITVPCLGAAGQADLAGLAGRPALLNVWASWCQPCREEVPALAAYAARPDAVPVLGINVLDRPESALDLLLRSGARYPSVVDTNGRLRSALRWPRVLPTSYLLRPDGRIEPIRDPAVFRSADQIAQTIIRAGGP